MKTKDISIGQECFATIGGRSVKVSVAARTTVTRYERYGERSETPAFWVERCDNGRRLPKPRKAVSLRPLDGPAPLTEREAKRREFAKHNAERRKLARIATPCAFAGQFHCAVSCREVATAAREFRAKAEALGAQVPPASFAPWLRTVLRTHLSNKGEWLTLTEGATGPYIAIGARFERAKRGVTRLAAHAAAMLGGADPEVVQGLVSFVKVGG